MLDLSPSFNESNVFVVKHFSWGNIATFQRTGESQAALYIGASPPPCNPRPTRMQTATLDWRRRPRGSTCRTQSTMCTRTRSSVRSTAAECTSHRTGWNPPGVTRIRYPQIVDVRLRLPAVIFTPDFDDSAWFNPRQIQVCNCDLEVFCSTRTVRTVPADISAHHRDARPEWQHCDGLYAAGGRVWGVLV